HGMTSPRSNDEASAILASELARLASRRAALGEPGVHAVAGWTLEHGLEWEAALLAWRRNRELDASDASAVFHEGVCLLELGRYSDAAERFREAIGVDARTQRLDWFDEDPEYKLGNALHAAGDLAGAVAAYERSAEKNALGVDSLREIARCRIVRGERAQA